MNVIDAMIYELERCYQPRPAIVTLPMLAGWLIQGLVIALGVAAGLAIAG